MDAGVKALPESPQWCDAPEADLILEQVRMLFSFALKAFYWVTPTGFVKLHIQFEYDCRRHSEGWYISMNQSVICGTKPTNVRLTKQLGTPVMPSFINGFVKVLHCRTEKYFGLALL